MFNEYRNGTGLCCYYRVVLMTGQGNLGHQIASSLVKLILSHPITVIDWGISYDIQFSGSIQLKTIK
jgi:hypothetical protein